MARPHAPRRPRLLPLTLLLTVAACGDGGTPDAGDHGTLRSTQGLQSADRGLVFEGAEDPSRPYYHRFGELPFGVRREHTFRLRNRDAQPVNLLEVQEACQCVRVTALRLVEGTGSPRSADLERDEPLLVVPPGGLVEVVARVDTALIGSREANKDKLSQVRLRSDASNPYLTLELSFLTRQLFLLDRTEINLHDVGQGAGGGGELTVMTGLPGSPVRLLEVVECPPGLIATLDERFDGGEHFWRVLAELEPMQPRGAYRGSIWISTTDAEGQGDQGRLEVPVLAQVVEDVRIYPETLSFGLVPAGAEREVEGALQVLLPGLSVRITGATLEGPSAPHLGATYQPRTLPDDQGRAVMWDLRVTCDGQHPPGPVEATLVVELDDEQFPRLERPVRGVVR